MFSIYFYQMSPCLILCLTFIMACDHRPWNILTINVNKMSSQLKALALTNFLLANASHIIFLQEVTREALTYITNYTVVDNVAPDKETGTAILVRPDLVVQEIECLPDGRAISCKINNIVFINIYAPSGDKPARRKFYAEDICQLLRRNTDKLVVGGDFNCVLSDVDQVPIPTRCPELRTLVESYRLKDSWRVLNPDKTEYTHFYATGHSRLDRIYVSPEFAGNIMKTVVRPVVFSDHCSYSCLIMLPYVPTTRHKNIWKLNCSLLSEADLIAKFTTLWQQLLRSKDASISTIDWWVAIAKPAIRSFLMNYSREAAHWRKTTVQFYQQCLQDLARQVTVQPELFPEFQRFKARLLNDLRRESAGPVIRSQPVGAISGEPLSIYHLNRERKRREKLQIKEWITRNGRRTTDIRDIQHDIEEHFQTLFHEEEVDARALGVLLRRIPHVLTRTDRTHINDQFTLEEVKDAVHRSPKGKSPGLDGIPSEFYLKFFYLLGDTLKTMAIEIQRGTTIPAAFTEGGIVLIPKSSATPNIENVRPITLLNTDYKIIARCVASRLKTVMSKVISEYQTCAVPDRNIFDAVLAYRDCISCVKSERRRAAAVLLIDFKNAFDRISHMYLKEVMAAMGFGLKFSAMIQNMLRTATSSVIVNGSLSKKINISRSVRQGCPLSMALYAIALDPLLRYISEECRGINIGNHQLTCRAYADDLGVFMEDPADIDRLHGVLQKYERATGAIVSTKKTVLLPIRHRFETLQRDWYTIQRQHKVLGVIMSDSLQRMEALNWRDTLYKIRTVCKIHAARNLVLTEKVSVINENILARAWFLAQILPVPKLLARSIKQVIFWLLWRGDIFKVSMDTCTLGPPDGGLGLVDFNAKCVALFIKRTRAVAERRPDGPTAALFSNYRPQSLSAPVSLDGIPTSLSHVRHYFLHRSYVSRTALQGNVVAKIVQDLRGIPARNKWEQRLPHVDWRTVWRTLASPVIPAAVRATWYRVVNRTIATNSKLNFINISRTNECDICSVEDNIEHRFVCQRFATVWDTARDMVRLINRLPLSSITVTDATLPQRKPYPRTKRNATIWLLGHTIHCIFSIMTTRPLDFLTYLWTELGKEKDRVTYTRTFANFLQVAIDHAFKNIDNILVEY